MKTIKHGLLIIFLLQFIGVNYSFIVPAEKPKLIEKALIEKDAKKLSTFFCERLKVEIPGFKGNVSAKSAMNILDKFYNNYPVGIYNTNKHSITKDNTEILIGLYSNKKTKFPVLLNMRKENGKLLIYRILINEEKK